MDECRYIIHKHCGTIDVEDTLHTSTMWIGIKNVEAIGVTRSDLESLKKQVEEILEKP